MTDLSGIKLDATKATMHISSEYLKWHQHPHVELTYHHSFKNVKGVYIALDGKICFNLFVIEQFPGIPNSKCFLYLSKEVLYFRHTSFITVKQLRSRNRRFFFEMLMNSNIPISFLRKVQRTPECGSGLVAEIVFSVSHAQVSATFANEAPECCVQYHFSTLPAGMTTNPTTETHSFMYFKI